MVGGQGGRGLGAAAELRPFPMHPIATKESVKIKTFRPHDFELRARWRSTLTITLVSLMFVCSVFFHFPLYSVFHLSRWSHALSMSGTGIFVPAILSSECLWTVGNGKMSSFASRTAP